MPAESAVLINARQVNDGHFFDVDLLPDGERIAPSITCPPEHEVINAKGGVLIPDMLDDQIDDPGTLPVIFSRLRFSAH